MHGLLIIDDSSLTEGDCKGFNTSIYDRNRRLSKAEKHKAINAPSPLDTYKQRSGKCLMVA